MRLILASVSCCLLAACMGGGTVATLSDVDLPEDAPVAEALAEPAPDESAPRRGFFASLMAPRTVQGEAGTGEDAPVDADSAEAPPTEIATPAPPRRKGFSLFRRRPTPEPAVAPAPDPTPEPQVVPDSSEDENTDVENPPRRGLFAGLFARKPAPASEEEATVELASLAPDEAPAPRKQRRGLFARRGQDDDKTVPPGTLLPFGEMARVCDVPSRKLGKEVLKASGFRILDSAPGTTAPHPFYVTGFKDGCARTMTAALVIFGSPRMHEQIRYGLPSSTQPYSATDRAYEKLKGRLCGVSRKKPCGSRIGKLERNTVFLSIYATYGGNNSTWSNALLHDGAVVATDRKGG